MRLLISFKLGDSILLFISSSKASTASTAPNLSLGSNIAAKQVVNGASFQYYLNFNSIFLQIYRQR